MKHAVTVKGQITIPKAMRDHMGITQGQEMAFEAQPGGKVLIFPAKKSTKGENPFLRWMGTSVEGLSTEAVLRETRGDDAMR